MRRLTTVLTVLAASVLLTGSTLMAADNEEYGKDQGKDECLLVAVNCAQSVDSIQMRIERLGNEIAKGTAVYTVDELNILKRKLEEINKDLETLTTGS
jgi:hypothetical protein